MRTLTKAIATLALAAAAMVMVPNVADAAGVPTNLKQTDASGSSVSFAWDAVINADDYYTSWSTDGVNWSDGARAYGADDTYYDLSPGKTYYVRVCTMEEGATYSDPDIYSDWSAPLEVVTAPDASGMKPLSAVSTLPNSITLSWTAAEGATAYEVASGYGAEKVEGTTTDTSFTVPNLAADTLYWLYVTPVRTSISGYTAKASRLYDLYRTAEAPVVVTAPGTASGSNFGVQTFSSSSSSAATVSFYATDPSQKAAGYEVEIRKIKGGKKVKTVDSTSSISPTVGLKKNTPYKYRIRFYTLSNGQKLYGGYSAYRYFTLHKITGKRHYQLLGSTCKIKMKWKKVTGAKGYTVYISKSSNGGFKKVKSLGKNKKSITITKMGKKKLSKYTKYYIKVVAKVKDGKKTVKNDAQAIQSTY
nr:fibronectin type III domain-containing protein [Eubacterium sp.]